MQFTEQKLSELIKSVEMEFTDYLAKSEAVSAAPLVKAEDKPAEKPAEEKKPEQKEEKKEEKKDAPPAEKKPEGEAKPEEKPAAEEKKPEGEEKPAAPAEGQAAAPAQDGEGCDYDEQDLAHMHSMYSSMSKGELRAHHDSVKKALDAHTAKSGDMNMAKSEETKPVAVEVKPEIIAPNTEADMAKAELAAEKAKNSELKQTLETVQTILTKMVAAKPAPQAKAITTMEQINKSEDVGSDKQLTKNEIDATLLKKSQDPKLSKSDREAINAFYLAKADINTISHLLK